MSRFNVSQNHPLIPREQTFVVDRKIISFHSNDRNMRKYPKANYYGVTLPTPLKNIQSMRLVEITVPSSQYVFSRSNQNTKFTFRVAEERISYTVEIAEGSYNPEQLAQEIENKMNRATNHTNIHNQWRVAHNETDNKIYFGNIHQKFTLEFCKDEDYPFNCTSQKKLFTQSVRWGLPAYLGYKKQTYVAELTPPNWLTGADPKMGDPLRFSYVGPEGEYWLFKPKSGEEETLQKNYWVDTNNNNVCPIDILGESALYMEVDKYNSLDEIEPYVEPTMICRTACLGCGCDFTKKGGKLATVSSKRCDNCVATKTVASNGWGAPQPRDNTQIKCSGESLFKDSDGRVNSAFAKIPITCFPFSQVFDSRNGYLTNISHYHPPLERITKLYFRFRYHNGQLADFRCQPFNFSIEFNMLRDEQVRAMSLRIPATYRL